MRRRFEGAAPWLERVLNTSIALPPGVAAHRRGGVVRRCFEGTASWLDIVVHSKASSSHRMAAATMG